MRHFVSQLEKEKIMERFLTNTFSPMMIASGSSARVDEITLAEATRTSNGATSAVGHEVTAGILSALLQKEVPTNRVNLSVREGIIISIIPSFRASEAREFTFSEVSEAGFRCFRVTVTPETPETCNEDCDGCPEWDDCQTRRDRQS